MSNSLVERAHERKLSFAKFQVGDVYTCELAVTPRVMTQFEVLSGDSNPVHLDETHARARGFDGAVAFGGLMAVMLSRLVGMELPTRDVVIVQNKFDFRSPAYVGQTIQLRAEVAALHSSVETVVLKLQFAVAAVTVCTGQCLIKCT